MDYAEKLCKFKTITNTGKESLIKLANPRLVYYDTSFIDLYWKFINEKIKNRSMVTEIWNNFNALEAYNALYLDVDYEVAELELTENCNDIGHMYANKFIQIAGLNGTNFNIFFYVPDEFTKLETNTFKCGAHILIFTEETFNKERRLRIYNDVIQSILADEDFLSTASLLGLDIDQTNVKKIFDDGPLKQCRTLLPFAEKFKATRRYILTEYSIKCKVLILPYIHPVQQELEKDEDDLVLNTDDLEVEEELKVDEDVNVVRSKVAKLMLQFVESLKYLSERHPFWIKLSSHNERLKRMTWVLDYIYLAEFIEDAWNVNKAVDAAPRLLTHALIPVLTFTVKPGDKTDRIRPSECLRNIQSYANTKYSDDSSGWKRLRDQKLAHVFRQLRECDQGTPRYFKELEKAVAKIYCQDNADEAKQMTPLIYGQMLSVLKVAEQIFSNISFFIEEIMDGMTDEIRPFKSIRNRNYGLDPRKGCSFDDARLNPRNDNEVGAFDDYFGTITMWLKLFTCVMYYNNPNSFDAIRAAISCLVSHFVFITKSGKTSMSYIYNIRQTDELCPYPYNQWIQDDDSTMLYVWFMTLYKDYLYKELETSRKMGFMSEFMDMLRRLQPTIRFGKNPDITRSPDFKRDMDRLKENIVSMSSQNKLRKDPIEKPCCANSPYCPMRNGILEFVVDDKTYPGKKRGDIIFREDNFDIYMNCYTNIMWDPTYNQYKNRNAAYIRVLAMTHEIYPDNDIWEYVMMMYAQTLHSIGSRDQFHQFYGSGAEGKSLINDAMIAMLGVGGNVPIATKEFDDPIVRNPFGLGITLKPEAIIQTLKSSHDSGATAELINKRLATVAEPNTEEYGSRINVATGKQITGDSTLLARKIYSEPTLFIPKLYITVQTNTILGYSEDNDAVERRFAVIPHDAKFVTAAMAEKLGKSPNVHQVDRELSENVQTNPHYWQALFYVLLPFAQKFLQKGYKGLSDVPKPERIINLTNLSRTFSSGLIGWLATNFIAKDGGIISVEAVVARIFDANTEMKLRKEPPIFDRMMQTQPKNLQKAKICDLITSKFGNMALYKLQDKYINENGRPQGLVDIPQDGMTEEEFKDKFDLVPIANLSMYKYAPKQEYSCVFIKGYSFITPETDPNLDLDRDNVDGNQ